ncbi:MAG: Gfo/Idh/MocA family oxidoreductase [Planctomycetaceae bacterium]|jgi:predicted dehydrogenase|nr:Gfo/Idh/MocA family oxidoreductase [Planctomycetaceae bacterium]
MKRRDFVKVTSLGLGAGLTILTNGINAQETKANNKINVALIGCGGRGKDLLLGFNYPHARIPGFREFDDVNVLYACDVRKERGEKIAGDAQTKYVPDMRTVLDDPKVDAVICALPDHWHALAAVRACQAGKDVYTEKPASQSGWEGEQMVKAARKYKRIVQHGTQNRSAPYNIAAKKYIEDGKLGKIHLCRVFNQKAEMNSFKVQYEQLPENFSAANWSEWLGPASERPFSPTILNRNWHELWDFSSGDILNDGVHQIDLARWLVGVKFPETAYAAGGRFTDPPEKSDGQTPDTLIATYKFDDLIFTVEETLYTRYMLKIDPEVRMSDMVPYWMQCATAIELYGTKGLMKVARHGGGWQVFDRPKDRKPVIKETGHGRFPDEPHKRNFLESIRTRNLPNADIAEGHCSTALVHYSTVSYRLGGAMLQINKETGKIENNTDAAKYWKRDYRTPYVIPDEV